MGYQLDIYSLSWVDLEEKWFANHLRSTGERTTLGEVQAKEFAKAIRSLGKHLALLDHTSSDADEFLERFLEQVASTAFAEPRLRAMLIDRALFGLAGEVFPAWGGLKLEEIERMLERYNLPEGIDGDQESWLEDLHSALKDAHERKADIVTIYE